MSRDEALNWTSERFAEFFVEIESIKVQEDGERSRKDYA